MTGVAGGGYFDFGLGGFDVYGNDIDGDAAFAVKECVTRFVDWRWGEEN